jgi:acetyl esterase/lipase
MHRHMAKFTPLVLTPLLLGTALLHAQAEASAPPVQAFARVNAVAYAQGSAGPLLADMYLPQGTGLLPAIVLIHGGGWIHGDRTGSSKLYSLLASHGYAGMAIDYDLSPAVQFPVALEECKEAVRWLRAHAAEYHVDPERIAVLGASAGGELAALVALTGDDPRYESHGGSKNFSSSVKAGILLSADLDLTPFSESDESILPYLGGSCSSRRELCLQASPQFQLRGKLPPIYISQGNADHDVPYSQLTNFVAAYRKANGPITEFTIEGAGHNYGSNPQWFEANADATLLFLQKIL